MAIGSIASNSSATIFSFGSINAFGETSGELFPPLIPPGGSLLKDLCLQKFEEDQLRRFNPLKAAAL
jgi:hypothetical protein